MKKSIVTLLALLLAGCASTSQRCQPLASGARYCLQPVAAQSSASLQMVQFSGRGLNERSLFQLENDGHSLRLAGMTPMGQSLLSLVWDGRALQAESMFGSRVTQQALPLLMLVQWQTLPEAQVLAGLSGKPAYWVHLPDGRRLVVDGNAVLRQRWQPDGGSVVELPDWGFTLRFSPLPQAGGD